MIIATGLKEAAKLSCFPGRFTATELFFYNNQNGPAYPEWKNKLKIYIEQKNEDYFCDFSIFFIEFSDW